MKKVLLIRPALWLINFIKKFKVLSYTCCSFDLTLKNMMTHIRGKITYHKYRVFKTINFLIYFLNYLKKI